MNCWCWRRKKRKKKQKPCQLLSGVFEGFASWDAAQLPLLFLANPRKNSLTRRREADGLWGPWELLRPGSPPADDGQTTVLITFVSVCLLSSGFGGRKREERTGVRPEWDRSETSPLMDILACRPEENSFSILPSAMLFHGLPAGDVRGVVEEMERRGKTESAAISSAIDMGESEPVGDARFSTCFNPGWVFEPPPQQEPNFPRRPETPSRVKGGIKTTTN